LQHKADTILGQFCGRASHSALAAAGIAATRQRMGRMVEIRDVQIAGIATARRATLATRNTRCFEDTGVDLVDPWN
jgi:hypothetical protein